MMNPYSKQRQKEAKELSLALGRIKMQKAVKSMKDISEAFRKFELPQDPPSLIAEVIGRLSSELNRKLEDFIIEGLKRKGFDFENRIELENFIKSNCRCEDNIDFKERIYYVNDIPFFLHKYEVIQEPITQYNNGVRMSANLGTYAYL